jgi:hypothetical protein
LTDSFTRTVLAVNECSIVTRVNDYIRSTGSMSTYGCASEASIGRHTAAVVTSVVPMGDSLIDFYHTVGIVRASGEETDRQSLRGHDGDGMGSISVLAKATVTAVCVDRSTGLPSPFPDEVRNRFVSSSEQR